MSTFDLTSVATSGHNTRLNTPFQPELGNEIIYSKVKRLGGGSQGNVYEVVDMYTGEHHACKVIQPKPMPKLGITTEKDFKLKVEAEVALISKMRSVSFFILAELQWNDFLGIRSPSPVLPRLGYRTRYRDLSASLRGEF
jgi:serine/threonine protein kinase